MSAKAPCHPREDRLLPIVRIIAESAEPQHLLGGARTSSRQQLCVQRNQILPERSKSILNRHSSSLAGASGDEETLREMFSFFLF